MRIISHRGKGFDITAQPNSLPALEESIRQGFGIETDIRDCCGELIISHDMGQADCPKLNILLERLTGYPKQCLAINIKADGIGKCLLELLNKYSITDYFTFDMSLPQMLEYRDLGLTYFTRQSDYETAPLLYETADGVWIDSFEDDGWINAQLIIEHINEGKKVCIVSPELHGRVYLDLWSKLKSEDLCGIMLCTDYPQEANRFFTERMSK